MNNKELGFRSESAVISFMEKHGFSLIVRNYNVHNAGELDAVMIRDDTVAVIEVKSRRCGEGEFSAASAITPAKLRRMRRTVRHLIPKYRLWGKDIFFLAGLVTHDDQGNIKSLKMVPIDM